MKSACRARGRLPRTVRAAPAAATRRNGTDGERVAHADVDVRDAGRREVRAAERRGQRGARREHAPETRGADEADPGRDERSEHAEDGRRRQLDREGDGEIQEEARAADGAEEVVEPLARPRDSLHEEEAGAVAGDPLRETSARARRRRPPAGGPRTPRAGPVGTRRRSCRRRRGTGRARASREKPRRAGRWRRGRGEKENFLEGEESWRVRRSEARGLRASGWGALFLEGEERRLRAPRRRRRRAASARPAASPLFTFEENLLVLFEPSRSAATAAKTTRNGNAEYFDAMARP